MRLKPGVKLVGLTPQMFLAAVVVERALFEFDLEAVITSGSEGRHIDTSLHYSGNALDFRTYKLTPGEAMSFANDVKDRLGRDFDVVLEKDHLHVEYDPK